MNIELARTLTVALVSYLDENRPEGTMDCSSAECEAIEQAFIADNFFYVETLIKKKLSRLTEFEKVIKDRLWRTIEYSETFRKDENKYVQELAAELLDFAREQFIKDGYVIEKKAFHDAVEKVDPKVMKEVSDNVDKENELAEKYLEGYTKGYKDAEKFYNDFVAYRNPTMPTTDFGCDGIRCTNPHMDCINCPRKTTGGFYTTCGTSAVTMHGNTSATDGKEHNPSFSYANL